MHGINSAMMALVISALVSLLSPAGATAESPELGNLVQQVQAHYEKVDDLSAEFEQESQVLGSRRTRKASGTVKFKKPGQMRWDYATPVVQAYVSDGEKFYYYNSTEKFVAIRKLEQAFDSPTPNDFLQGLGKLEKSFKITAPREGIVDAEGRYRLALTPMDQRGGYTLTLILDPKSLALWGVAFTDAMGSVSTVRFVNVKENAGLKDKAFAFEIPEGVKVKQDF
jgi:outer membrane lipoprotein-sorting protein